jgi:hypothetical protein
MCLLFKSSAEIDVWADVWALDLFNATAFRSNLTDALLSSKAMKSVSGGGSYVPKIVIAGEEVVMCVNGNCNQTPSPTPTPAPAPRKEEETLGMPVLHIVLISVGSGVTFLMIVSIAWVLSRRKSRPPSVVDPPLDLSSRFAQQHQQQRLAARPITPCMYAV